MEVLTTEKRPLTRQP